ncbi:XRE family transcriptional regulator [Candidatus Acidianus copahuensis]|uniref:XRE family transcriptional regulator n=1 Tax=Candidatus Acidianus copahuensis TaxID=1160895 RepID=A0A031LV92_9CREN|nr:XRE family transcriptional regulator [Candidatus Acidianus copahuensis]
MIGIVVALIIIVGLISFELYSNIQKSPPYESSTNSGSKINLRVISLSPSDTQILVSLGLGKYVVGVDSYSYSLLKSLNDTSLLPYNITIFNQISPPNISGLVELKPSVIIGEEGLIGNYFTQMKEAGLNVYLTNDDFASNYYEIEQSIMNVSRLFNSSNEGNQLNQWMNQKLQEFSTTGNISVADIIWICPNYDFFTAGGNVFINSIISLSGGINVFGSQSGYPLLNPGQLLLANPDVIFVQVIYNLSYTEYLVNHMPGIQNVSAYKDHRIYFISENAINLVNEPGPLSVYAIPMIHDIIYGEAPEYINWTWVKQNINPTLPVY